MANDKQSREKPGNLKPDEKEVRSADQAEGERKGKTSAKVKPTPGTAEGDRETVEQDIRNKERQGKL
jgi:hypothetical protein